MNDDRPKRHTVSLEEATASNKESVMGSTLIRLTLRAGPNGHEYRAGLLRKRDQSLT